MHPAIGRSLTSWKCLQTSRHDRIFDIEIERATRIWHTTELFEFTDPEHARAVTGRFHCHRAQRLSRSPQRSADSVCAWPVVASVAQRWMVRHGVQTTSIVAPRRPDRIGCGRLENHPGRLGHRTARRAFLASDSRFSWSGSDNWKYEIGSGLVASGVDVGRIRRRGRVSRISAHPCRRHRRKDHGSLLDWNCCRLRSVWLRTLLQRPSRNSGFGSRRTGSGSGLHVIRLEFMDQHSSSRIYRHGWGHWAVLWLGVLIGSSPLPRIAQQRTKLASCMLVTRAVRARPATLAALPPASAPRIACVPENARWHHDC